MAKPTIAASDNISTVVTQHNSIVDDVGDWDSAVSKHLSSKRITGTNATIIGALNTLYDSVDAVKTLLTTNTTNIGKTDSAHIGHAFTGGDGVQYNPVTRTINTLVDSAALTGGDFQINAGMVTLKNDIVDSNAIPNDTIGTEHYKDSSITYAFLQNNSIKANNIIDEGVTKDKFTNDSAGNANPRELKIFNAAGSVVKTMYSPGS